MPRQSPATSPLGDPKSTPPLAPSGSALQLWGAALWAVFLNSSLTWDTRVILQETHGAHEELHIRNLRMNSHHMHGLSL
eukprot:15839882-Heterocapsa_arctica.AAC.1